MNQENSSFWYDAMKEEMESMIKNKVWELVTLPNRVSLVGCKWIYKTKRDSLGDVERYNDRLVSKGFTQREGIDYHETFSPLSKKGPLRIIMELVAHFDLELHQMDVKRAFLNEDLTEDVYMCQPEGFVNPDNNKLIWMLHETKQFLAHNFDMKDIGEASYVIGIEIHQDRARKSLSLSQKAYINKVLERFRMLNCSSISAPLVKGETLSFDQCPKNAIGEV
ncbi:retrovirus-related pol polyprotein from transposon TNT 1-94 [Tanacetum coccineum]